MANPGLLHLLFSDLDGWNAWREEHPGPTDLEGADLSKKDLARANLSNARLTDANLYKTNLEATDLSGADLVGAELSRANLKTADLTEATLSGATLAHANLVGARLSRAALVDVNMNGAALGVAALAEARLELAKLRGANLKGANLSGADLTRADLREASLVEVDLTGAEVSGSSFEWTTITGVDLSRVSGLSSTVHHGPSTVGLDVVDRTAIGLSMRPVAARSRVSSGQSASRLDALAQRIGQPIDFYSCFISYSHDDKAFARRLFDHLQACGIRCWLDDHEVLPGDDIYEAVDQGIRLWDKVLLCCSESSLTSWWVDDEMDRAFEKERQLMKQRGRKTLAVIPLDLDGYLFSDRCTSAKKQPLTSRLAADSSGWGTNDAKFREQFELVLAALRADPGGRSQPPSSKL